MTPEELADEWWELKYRLELSVLYHVERRRFFEVWSNTARVLSFLASSSAVIALLLKDYPRAALALAGAVAIIQVVDLVVGFARKLWTHADLASKFLELLNRLTLADETSESELKKLQIARRDVAKSEPPCKPYLVEYCEEALNRRLNLQPTSKDSHKLNGFLRTFRHYLPDFGPP